MDEGIDERYTNYFGLKPQNEVQKKIKDRPEGYLPVGAAVYSAPTMLVPQPVPVVNSTILGQGQF